MKVVIQRVNKSSVEINNKIKSEIQKGLLVLIGIGLDDNKFLKKTEICYQSTNKVKINFTSIIKSLTLLN